MKDIIQVIGPHYLSHFKFPDTNIYFLGERHLPTITYHSTDNALELLINNINYDDQDNVQKYLTNYISNLDFPVPYVNKFFKC